MPTFTVRNAILTYFGEEVPTPPEWVKYVVYQKESCPETGREHYQMYAEFTTKKTLKQIQEWLPGAHVERRYGKQEQAIQYCTKEESRIAGPWEHGQRAEQGQRTDIDEAMAAAKEAGPRRMMDVLSREHPGMLMKYPAGVRLYQNVLREQEQTKYKEDAYANWQPREWQQRIIDIVDEPADDRTIYWVRDTHGQAGKSTLANWLSAKKEAVVLEGKLADMAHCYDGHPIVIFDICKSAIELTDHLYGFAEKLKSGGIFKTKYESKFVQYKPPHVIFFSNDMPNRRKWSDKRPIEVIDLDDSEEASRKSKKARGNDRRRFIWPREEASIIPSEGKYIQLGDPIM